MKKFEPQPGFVVRAYRFALDPNAGQERALRSHCGAARASYNWAVSWVEASWWQRKAEQSYGIAEQELTPWRPWSLPALRKAFNEAKRTDPRFASWWEENSKEAYSTGLANAAAAFEAYSRSRRGQRRGKPVGKPTFKSKHKARLACRFTTGVIRVEADRRHVTLPRLGTIRTHESTRKLERRIADGTARILSATVRQERGRWFVAFQVEVGKTERAPVRPDVAVGVDLGVKCLAVLADSAGQVRYVPGPRHHDSALKQLKRLSRRVSRRQGPAVYDPVTGKTTRREPSKRWRQADAERNKVHHRVANLRTDALHKLTTGITAEYGTVVVEDLNVAGMLGNRRLARKIADAGLAEIRRQITYKTGWRGGATVVADRWYPSSKTCSNCGEVKAKLPLRVRVFTCDTCGLVIDRDENAATNLAALAANVIMGTGVAGDPDAQASKPRGADQKTRATRTRRKTEAGRAGGAVPQHSGRKRETVIRTPKRNPRSGDTGTDLPDGNVLER
ncbi:IS607 family element RNA-guided endonuclease TnpB [Nonomuraea sp. B10E15]|uniref:IS607 family element RNA-guided endonuclease TnpB n=1 Tax=Nonomuraea sp. B10E15 TaxID=3153560 RepID=UPI00325F6018